MKSVLSYILKNSLRDRLYVAILFAIVISFCVSIFLGQTMLSEQSETAVILAFGSSRVVIIVGLILFTCLAVRKSFENKEIEFILSRKVSRESFALSYFLSFILISLALILPTAFAISFLHKTNLIGLSFWIFSLLLEATMVSLFSFLAAIMVKNTFIATFISLAFYIISRLMSMFTMAANLPQDTVTGSKTFLLFTLKILSSVFPRFDLFCQSSWLLYPIDDFTTIKLIFIQSALYIPLMIVMVFHDLKRKQF